MHLSIKIYTSALTIYIYSYELHPTSLATILLAFVLRSGSESARRYYITFHSVFAKMFDKAKNFVIHNGAFIDYHYIKKVYLGSSQSTRSKDIHQGDSQLISNYTQLKTGDIHVLDGRVQVDKVYNDVVVEVIVGETKKRAARLYRGPRGQARLKMELELLSELGPYPQIRQVYGIFNWNDITCLVFHDDGTHKHLISYTSMTSNNIIGRHQTYRKYVVSATLAVCGLQY
ncbi:hypothetical protein BDQ17DRAFT_827004 [Cyathus striatus]|nr:hypothetical protein BDQ17DRAFT_827004 [Cyathus striatus]